MVGAAVVVGAVDTVAVSDASHERSDESSVRWCTSTASTLVPARSTDAGTARVTTSFSAQPAASVRYETVVEGIFTLATWVPFT